MAVGRTIILIFCHVSPSAIRASDFPMVGISMWACPSEESKTETHETSSLYASEYDIQWVLGSVRAHPLPSTFARGAQMLKAL